jgi:hypothetical protein
MTQCQLEKPNISELFDAVIRFSGRNTQAGFSPRKWRKSRDLFIEDLRKLGIVDRFDWSEK